ncbi:MAG TPA: permease prefix domain 1-containing protein [Streptosporangiaceae bacterium]|nr:permease prefix domain 1-containing protein [Streptosporangiaceae bacterium]
MRKERTSSGPGQDGRNEPVEEYLDRIPLTAPGTPRQVRRSLAELEAHLRDAVAAGMAGGLGEHEAQVAAVQRMGPVRGATGRSPFFARPTVALARLDLTPVEGGQVRRFRRSRPPGDSAVQQARTVCVRGLRIF